MKTKFKSTFAKDLKRIKDKTLLSRVQAAIIAVEQTDNLLNVASCKKMQGGENYYRIRIGDFRIGLSMEDDVVIFVRFLSRGDIYKHFP